MEQIDQDPNFSDSTGKAGMGKGTTKIGCWYFRYCPVCGLLERKHVTCAGDWKEVEGDWVGLRLTEFRELEEWIDYGDRFHDASVHDFGYYAPMKCEHWMENELEEEEPKVLLEESSLTTHRALQLTGHLDRLAKSAHPDSATWRQAFRTSLKELNIFWDSVEYHSNKG